MSAAAKPEATLIPRHAARLQEIKARNALVTAINGQSWGASLTPLQQRAFAEYMRRFNLDIGEIDNLGGRPYRNGRYYMRRIAELVREGRVEWYEGEHIGPDDRLVAAADAGDEWAVTENTRRFRERIRLGVPADATFVYVMRVKMKELEKPTEAVKFYVPDRKKKVWRQGKQIEVNTDPVGDENPETSVETRAWRRVGRLCAAEIPELKEQEREMEFAADATQEAVIAEAVAADERNDAAHIEPKPVSTQGRDAYDETTPDAPALTEGAAREVIVPPKEASTVHRTADFTVEDDD